MNSMLLALPIALIELIVMIIALIDLARSERTNGPKWVWVIVIVFFQLIGSIVYFIFGRKNA